MNFLYLFEDEKIMFEIFQNYLPFKASNFFRKSIKSLLFSSLNIFKRNKFEKKVFLFKKLVRRRAFPSLVDIEYQRFGVFLYPP